VSDSLSLSLSSPPPKKKKKKKNKTTTKKKKKKKKKPTTQKKKKRRRERASLTYYILRNQTYMSPQIIQPDVFDVMVINKYTACLRCKEQICTLD